MMDLLATIEIAVEIDDDDLDAHWDGLGHDEIVQIVRQRVLKQVNHVLDNLGEYDDMGTIGGAGSITKVVSR